MTGTRPASEGVGRKDDDGKVRLDLLPWDAREVVGHVLTVGARKYSPENWRFVADWRARYGAALLRHYARWSRGERCDPETGLPHLAHLVCCGLFLLALDTPEVRDE